MFAREKLLSIRPNPSFSTVFPWPHTHALGLVPWEYVNLYDVAMNTSPLIPGWYSIKGTATGCSRLGLKGRFLRRRSNVASRRERMKHMCSKRTQSVWACVWKWSRVHFRSHGCVWALQPVRSGKLTAKAKKSWDKRPAGERDSLTSLFLSRKPSFTAAWTRMRRFIYL